MKITSISNIIQDVVNGCTANNAREDKMNFNINYRINDADGKLVKEDRHFVWKLDDLESILQKIIIDNLGFNSNVTITDITIFHYGESIRVNKTSYFYSLMPAIREYKEALVK